MAVNSETVKDLKCSPTCTFTHIYIHRHTCTHTNSHIRVMWVCMQDIWMCYAHEHDVSGSRIRLMCMHREAHSAPPCSGSPWGDTGRARYTLSMCRVHLCPRTGTRGMKLGAHIEWLAEQPLRLPEIDKQEDVCSGMFWNATNSLWGDRSRCLGFHDSWSVSERL